MEKTLISRIERSWNSVDFKNFKTFFCISRNCQLFLGPLSWQQNSLLYIYLFLGGVIDDIFALKKQKSSKIRQYKLF